MQCSSTGIMRRVAPRPHRTLAGPAVKLLHNVEAGLGHRYRRRTIPAQSGALENKGRRETKISLAADSAVWSSSRRSLQIWGFSKLRLGGERSAQGLNGEAKGVWILAILNDPPELHGEACGHRAIVVPFGDARVGVLEECCGKARGIACVAVRS